MCGVHLQVNVGIGKSRFTGLKAPLVIQSNAPAYFDIIMCICIAA